MTSKRMVIVQLLTLHAAKHFAFTRCGELNLFGMVDTHLAVVEGELLAPRL